jgi:hypothetical protein
VEAQRWRLEPKALLSVQAIPGSGPIGEKAASPQAQTLCVSPSLSASLREPLSGSNGAPSPLKQLEGVKPCTFAAFSGSARSAKRILRYRAMHFLLPNSELPVSDFLNSLFRVFVFPVPAIRIPCSRESYSPFFQTGFSPRTTEFRGSAGQFGASLGSKKCKFPVNFAKFPVNFPKTGNFRQKEAGRGHEREWTANHSNHSRSP